MGGEIVTLHIGQAGVQISHALWELVCVEHGINAGGRRTVETVNLDGHETGREYVFREVMRDKFVPRALLIDLEPSVIDEIRTGAYRDLWHPLQLINGKEDAASNFARGYYSQSRFEMNDVLDRIRILVEQCENLACFKLLYSANGGTGSGLTSALCERLSDEYGKKHKFATTVYPSPGYSELMVEPYNALLHSSTNMTFCDCVVITDNEAMLNVVEDSLRLHHAGFTVPNRVIANAITTQFLSHRYRFVGQQHCHVNELLINLVPYPRIHFPMMAFAPFLGPACQDFEKSSAVDLVRSVFEDTNQLLSVSAVRRAYISCALLFRGSTTPLEAIKAISAIKGDRLSRARFVDWCPTGFKIGVNYAAPIQAPTANTVSLKNSSLSMIAGNLSIRDVWTGIGRRFDQLYEKRAYVHWYVAEGMEEGEFTLAREVIKQLVEDYEAIAKDAEGAVYESSNNQSQNQITKSLVRLTPVRSPHNRTEPNINQATTLDEQNSLRTLDNNEEQLSLDTNQHHTESVLEDNQRYNRARRSLDGEWGPRYAFRSGFPQSRMNPSQRNRLRFPERSQQSYVSGSVERFQNSSNALMESIAPQAIYGTNCSAAVFSRAPIEIHHKPELHHANSTCSLHVTSSKRRPTRGNNHEKPSGSSKRSLQSGSQSHCLTKHSGIPRFSDLHFAEDIYRKLNIQVTKQMMIDTAKDLGLHRNHENFTENHGNKFSRERYFNQTNNQGCPGCDFENFETAHSPTKRSDQPESTLEASLHQAFYCKSPVELDVPHHQYNESESTPDTNDKLDRSGAALFSRPTDPDSNQLFTNRSERTGKMTQSQQEQTHIRIDENNQEQYPLPSADIHTTCFSRPHHRTPRIAGQNRCRRRAAMDASEANSLASNESTEYTELSESAKLKSYIQSLQSVSLEACEVKVTEEISSPNQRHLGTGSGIQSTHRTTECGLSNTKSSGGTPTEYSTDNQCTPSYTFENHPEQRVEAIETERQWSSGKLTHAPSGDICMSTEERDIAFDKTCHLNTPNPRAKYCSTAVINLRNVQSFVSNDTN